MLGPVGERPAFDIDPPVVPMEKSQFCFWLQGHFEVVDKGAPLSAQQLAIVSAKLVRAERHPTPAAGKPAAFCIWLRGQLDAHELIVGQGADMSQEQTDEVKQRLDGVFVHAAAPRRPAPKPAHDDHMNQKYLC